MSKTHFTTIALVLAMATTVDGQTYKVLYNFGSNPGDPSGPFGTITQSPGGNLYTAANDDRTDGIGSIVKMGTNGTVKVIHYFNGIDGKNPVGGLTFATDQQFHGTTEIGTGIDNNHGSIFRVTPDGKLITQYVFKGGLDGGLPVTPPIQSVSGNYYGTTFGEFGYNWGSIYKITEAGDFTLLHAFNGLDGAFVSGPLLQGTDFGFYGVTQGGGNSDAGVIFRCSSEGNFKVLHNFDIQHGGYPTGVLIQANDGNFYGTAGGARGAAVIFRLTPSLTYTVLHYFTGGSGLVNRYNGLLEASDGNFYGTTYPGEAGTDPAVLYRITPAGAYTVLHVFDPLTTVFPLIQHTNGKLYGTTGTFAREEEGVFFRLDAGLPPFVTFLTVYGRVGAHVVILGQHFTNDSVVSFNGVPAQNPEITPTYIKAIVPDGATTGPITVTTTTGTLKSNKTFVIH